MTYPNRARLQRATSWSVSLLLTVPLAAQGPSGGTVGAPDGTTQPFPEAALPLQWADFDGDSIDDALVVTTAGSLVLLQSRTDGTFLNVTEWAGLEHATGVRVTVFQDYDHDGWADVFAARADGGTHLMRNTGGTFVDVATRSGIACQGAPLSAHWMDYDNDGLLDLHLVSERANTLYQAVGGDAFTPVELPVLVTAPAVPGRTTTSGGSTTLADAGQLDPGTPLGGAAGTTVGGTSVTATPTTPSGTASVLACATSLADAGGPGCIAASSDAMLGMLYPLSDTFFVDDDNGRVGINTIEPSAAVHVAGGTSTQFGGGGYVVVGNIAGKHISMDGDEVMARNFSDGPGFATLSLNRAGGAVLLNANAGTPMVGIGTAAPTVALDVAGSGAFSGNMTVGTLDVNGDADFSGNTTVGALDASGDVELFGALDVSGDADFSGDVTVDDRLGIRTTTPSVPLHVDGGTDVYPGGGGYFMTGSIDGSNITLDENEILSRNDGSPSKLFVNYEGGDILLNAGGGSRVGIGLESPDTTLDVNGAITIRGGADIVETFESSCGTIEPGTVVVIDPENPGALMCSRTAYDTKVAGVVSGAGGVNPGLLLGQDDMFTGDTRVAMTGRVYVNCSTENGAIRPGDRLTTATIEGHAMRVSEERPSSGCVIGKAMSSLSSGSGLVLVLVNLQ